MKLFNPFQNLNFLKTIPAEWDAKIFTDVFKDSSGGNLKIQKSEFSGYGALAIVDQGQSIIAGYTDDITAKCNVGDEAIVFGDHTRAVKYTNFPFAMGADGTKVLQIKENHSYKYLYYFLKSVELPSDGYSRHFKHLKSVIIPLPPLPIQKKIVQVLDKAQELIDLREKQLKLLDDLVQSIFYDMFGDLIAGIAPIDGIKCSLGAQITLQRGKDITKKQANRGEIPVISSGGISFYHDTPLIKGPGVLLGRKGSVGKVHYSDIDYWPHDTTLYVKDFKDNIPLFVYHFFNNFPISQYEASAANPSLNRNNLHPVVVGWPTISHQNEFATKVQAIEAQKALMQQSLEQMKNNYNSLMQRAFRGDLFPD